MFNPATDIAYILDASDASTYTLAGNLVTSWRDKLGGPVEMVQGTTGATAQRDATLFGGRGGMKFLPSSPSSMITNGPIPAGIFANNNTVFWVMRRNAAAMGPNFANYDEGEILDFMPTISCVGYNQTPIGLAAKRSPLLTDMIYVARSGTDNILTHFIGNSGPINTYFGSQGHGFTSQLTRLSIAKAASQAGTADISVGLQMLCNRALTDDEVQEAIVYIKTTLRWNTNELSQPYNVLMAGNSLTDTTAQGVVAPWPVLLPQSADIGQNNFLMAAKGGATLGDLTGWAAAQVDAYYIPTLKNKNVCVVWEITNELDHGVGTVQGTIDLLVAYCTARRALGWKVIVATCLPRDNSIATFEVDRQAVNLYVRTNYRKFADGLADVGADGNGIGTQGDQNGPNYLNDFVHLDESGHVIATRIFFSAFQLLGGNMAVTPINATVNVPTAGTRVRINSAIKAVQFVYIEALHSNTGKTYVGVSDVSGTKYIASLDAKQGVELSANSLGSNLFGGADIDLSSLYVDAETNGNKVQVTYMKRGV